MAVVALNSTAIANAVAKPQVFNSANISRGKAHVSIGTLAVTNGDSIGSTYRLARIRSSDRVSGETLFCGAITGAAANIGLYRTAQDGGAVVSASFFGAAQSIATALNGVNITYAGVVTLALMEKRIWELLGLSADPGVDYDIVATLTAAATATGQLALHSSAVSGE